MRQPTTLDAVLFDLDGTLIDTAADFVYVMEQLCAEHDRPTPSQEAVHQTVSGGARALVKLAFDLEPDHPQCAVLLRRLLDIYAEALRSTQAVLYPGMEDLLSWLEDAGIAWGIVTNKPLSYSQSLLASLGLAERCGVLICPDMVSKTKPDPEPVHLACRRLQAEEARSIYVGDHPRDIEAGRRAGLFTIAAAYGYLSIDPPVDTWGADMIVESVEEITQWLDSTYRSSTGSAAQG